tara:strand:+ start:14 stop:562 length:549 start_codon:yes stop_codon:yes gene_type:complete
MNEVSDNELLKMFQEPKTRNEAFNHIINNNQERIYWHVRKIVLCHEDANDITQNTFLLVYKNLNKFNGKSKIYTWIYRIATNESITFLKKQKKHVFEPLENVSSRLKYHLQEDVYFDGNKIEKKLQETLLELPIKQKIAFNMKYFENMKYKEISEILGTSIGALKANYHHAKEKIKKKLELD